MKTSKEIIEYVASVKTEDRWALYSEAKKMFFKTFGEDYEDQTYQSFIQELIETLEL